MMNLMSFSCWVQYMFSTVLMSVQHLVEVGVCGPASQAVNDGVSEACSGAVEQHRSH